MLTRVLPAGEAGAIEAAVAALRAGQAVAFPTDTVYGVGAHAFIEAAVASLYAIKERSPEKAIPLLIAGPDDMVRVAAGVPARAWEWARRFWPGALTLVLPKAAHIPEIVSAGPGVAVRVPDHPATRALIRRLGDPLATTSANLSGRPSPITAADVLEQLDGRLPLVLDGGACAGGVPSTVVDLTGAEPRILRQGAITAAELGL